MTICIVRQLLLGILFCYLIETCAIAGPIEDGRIAIIDVSDSLVAESDGRPIRPKFEHLRNSGVLVIGRYFSRCQQHHADGTLWRKRLIDGDPSRPDGEAEAILQNGFAIMSIYQYNNREAKFSGSWSGPACIKTKYEKEIRKASTQAREGILDAEAALAQAAAVKQPPRTAIYFGVDYDFTNKDQVQVKGVLDYFREIKKQFDAAGYLVGAYADGAALTLLLGDNPRKEKLIDIAWLVPSSSYTGNSDFHTNRRWHLFQSQADNKILISNDGRCIDIEYDVNVQNIDAVNDDLGFWDKAGVFRVPEARTAAIFNQRRFVCDRRDLSLSFPADTCESRFEPRSCAYIPGSGEPCFARTVRLKPGQKDGAEFPIDFRDYGRFDGVVKERRLTRSLSIKPRYESAPWASNLCP